MKTITQPGEGASNFIRSHSNTVTAGDSTYHFLPFWFKELGDGKFEMHQLGDLPVELEKEINAQRYKSAREEYLKNPVEINTRGSSLKVTSEYLTGFSGTESTKKPDV